MINPLLMAMLAGLLMVISPLGRTGVGEPRSCAEVPASLAAGVSAAEIIRANVESGMTLSEATVAVMVCGGERNQAAIATTGIDMASNLAQARLVANAVLATAGQDGDMVIAVDAALQDYAKNMPQPSVYEDDYTPTGGSVSPAS